MKDLKEVEQCPINVLLLLPQAVLPIIINVECNLTATSIPVIMELQIASAHRTHIPLDQVS